MPLWWPNSVYLQRKPYSCATHTHSYSVACSMCKAQENLTSRTRSAKRSQYHQPQFCSFPPTASNNNNNHHQQQQPQHHRFCCQAYTASAHYRREVAAASVRSEVQLTLALTTCYFCCFSCCCYQFFAILRGMSV